ncbi:hypothetical protein HS088_TW21G00911 [Tripterygium wilfordii]|uniref:RRM domain-containing protein n=1 Tax=Tripterygium wilfordii TaxID=458696 RepID=A0A7J7C3M3_TRIWF|nr:uncharacterized protein LOC119988393 [Tripterygium wilfordii]KAF5728759.1 hypothetical protein HS088_TW21G00911 [Tripterygium wilfordii]
MASKAEAEADYSLFEEKVRRTVYVDNLTPQATESVLRTAFNQFGSVRSVQLIPNYLEPKTIPQCALVEMEKPDQAKEIISILAQYPFMISGMPRPVRARAAEPGMFDDRPTLPGLKVRWRWLEPNDPKFEVATKLKGMTRRHASEASFLLKSQLDQEEMLAKEQAASLKANYKKYEMLDGLKTDRTAHHLAHHYNMGLKD